MRLRIIDASALSLGLAAGLALSPGTIAGEASRMLVTFLGLVSARILPTISLLLGNMTANGRSVQSINALEAELQNAMDAMFLLFGSVAIIVGALVSLSTEPPSILVRVPYLTSEILPRLGQGIVVSAAALTLRRIGQIPAILRRSLSIRHEIAVEEAKRRTLENVPSAAATRASFETHPEFGKKVPLEEPATP